MAKAMNMKKRLKRAAPKKNGSEAQLQMMLSFRNRRHMDRKKEGSKRACRGKISL